MASGKGGLTDLERRILQFFCEHPAAVETVRGIASWTGDEQGAVQEAAQILSKRKWLTADETSVVTGYSLTRDERCLAQIHEVLGAA